MKAIQVAFEDFEKAKIKYAQQVADFAAKPANIDALYTQGTHVCELGVLKQLRPLLLDPTVSIQNSAALALGRIANHSPELAEAVVVNEMLPQLVMSLAQQSIFYKKAACFVLRSIAKHSSTLAKSIVNSGAIDSLAVCMEEFDPGVKESAAWALACIAKYNTEQHRHSEELAKTVVDSGCTPALVLALQQPDPNLKRISAMALSEISKHSTDLAQTVIDAGGAPFLNQLITHHDSQLKKYNCRRCRQVCQCLANISKHSLDQAEAVVAAELFPKILYRLKDTDESVRKMAAMCIREVVKHSPELSKLYVEAGGVTAIIEYLNENKGVARLPGILILGYIAGYDSQTAMSIITNKGIGVLKDSLIQVPDDLVKGGAAWALGQIGGHTPQHARLVAEEQTLTHLLAVYLYKDSTEELKIKARKAIKNIVKMCMVMQPLEALIYDSPPQILKYILQQFASILPKDKQAKKSFVMNDGLRKIQELKCEPGSKLKQYVDEIISIYPKDITQYYSASYQEALISKVQ